MSNVSNNLIMGMAKRDNMLGRDAKVGQKEMGIDLNKLTKVPAGQALR